MQAGGETDNGTGRVMDDEEIKQKPSAVPALHFYQYQEYDAV